MKHKQVINAFILILILVSVQVLTACGPSTPAAVTQSNTPMASHAITTFPMASPSITSMPSPPLTPTSIAIPTPSPTSPVTLVTTISSSPSPTIVAKPAEVTIASNKASFDFPNSITFAVSGTTVLKLSSITLEYGTNEHSIIEEVTKVKPSFDPGLTINTNYTWDMKKTGSLPPKAEVWYRWKFQDEAKREFVTPRQTISFEDTRFQWKLESTADLEIYYHDQDIKMIQDMVSGVQSNLSLIKLDNPIPPERKIKVLIYRDYEELKSSGLFKQEWTGGQAFPSYNIIIMAVNSNLLAWAKGALPHEITHLIVHESVFGPFDQIPTWLDEGLARYSEGVTGATAGEDKQILNEAIQDGSLISVRSLNSNFPADASQAGLAYAESCSVVSYLIETYGWDKIKTLLAIFKDGSTYDGALKKVYNFDTGGLEKEWRVKIGAGYN
jgi:hypothetical protein